MEFRVLKVDKQKTRCDMCQRAAPPITECQFPYFMRHKPPAGPDYSSQCQWVDLCADCIRVLEEDPERLSGFGTFAGTRPAQWLARHRPAKAAPAPAKSP